MKKLFFLKGFVLMSLWSVAQDTVRTYDMLTLKQSVEAAIVNNPTVKSSEFQKDYSAVNYNQSKGNLVPQLNGTINHSLNSGRSIDPASNGYINSSLTSANYNLSSNVTLFNGFYFA